MLTNLTTEISWCGARVGKTEAGDVPGGYQGTPHFHTIEHSFPANHILTSHFPFRSSGGSKLWGASAQKIEPNSTQSRTTLGGLNPIHIIYARQLFSFRWLRFSWGLNLVCFVEVKDQEKSVTPHHFVTFVTHCKLSIERFFLKLPPPLESLSCVGFVPMVLGVLLKVLSSCGRATRRWPMYFPIRRSPPARPEPDNSFWTDSTTIFLHEQSFRSLNHKYEEHRYVFEEEYVGRK